MSISNKVGRPRLSAAEKKKRGTAIKSREKKYVESTMKVLPMAKSPDAPKRLGKNGRDHWAVLIRELERNKMLAACDLGLLEALCWEWEMYLLHREAQKESGSYYTNKGKNGTTHIPHPIHYNGNNHLREYTRLCQEFGFSPASRARIGMAAQDKQESRAAKLIKNIGKAI